MSDQQIFKALSDPTRREILRQLTGGSRTAGELAERFEISKPSMSHHFNVLKTADLVRTRRNGQNIVYTLNSTVLEDATRVLLDIFGVNTADSPDNGGSAHEA